MVLTSDREPHTRHTEPESQKEGEAKAAARAEREAKANLVLNASNNEKLAQVLGVENPAGLLVERFAEEYAGYKIELDGVLASVLPYGGNDGGFDFLICVGDEPENMSCGHDFKYEDV